MKRILVLISALVLICGCNKIDPGFQNRPSITGEDPYFSQIEYAPIQEQSITIEAPNGFDMITISIPSGNPDFVAANAKKIIGIAANRNYNTLVMDMIDDSAVAAAFLSGRVADQAGSGVRGSKTPVQLNITRLVTLLVTGVEAPPTGTVIRFQIDVVDQAEYRTSQQISVHFTPAPILSWGNKNPSEAIKLEDYLKYSTVRVEAPARIASILLKVSASAPAAFQSWIRDRGDMSEAGYIDLLSPDSTMLRVVDSSAEGTTACSLDFSEVLANLKLYADKETAAGDAEYEFLLKVTDKLGRETWLEMKYKK